VGHTHQQTFIGTFARVDFAKLYTTKTPITSAELLNAKALPFYEQLIKKYFSYCQRIE
jgi:hypothetical protein